MADSIRKTAVLVLMNVEKNNAYVNMEMNKLRSSEKYNERDIRFISEIVNGVIKYKITLDYIISKYSKVPLKKISPYVLAVLRSGIYQLLYMDKIPDSAAVNESVKLIKQSSVGRLSGYVNAILRAVSPDDINNLKDDSPENISIKYSFPEWLTKRWCREFGIDFAVKLIESLNNHPSLVVRCNCMVTTPDELEKSFDNDGVVYEKCEIKGFSDFNVCYKILKVNSLYELESFRNGWFYVQDSAAAVAAYITDPHPGHTVIDMCSAPGGKSLYMAELMGDKGRIISCDIYEHKIKLIKDNANKHKHSIIEPMINDALTYNPEFSQIADRVLCDVPCSGFGIIRKKPDIKYSRKESDIKELADMGITILNNAAKYVKKNGIIVFSTCTVENEENELVVKKFLDENTNFVPVAFGDENCYLAGYKTFYPCIDGTDGFFVAKFRKVE